MTVAINMSGVVKRYASRAPVTLTQRTAIKFKGTAQQPTEVTTTLADAIVQRCKAEDAKYLPEGIRTDESVWIYMTNTVLTGPQAPANSDGTMRLADRIGFMGEQFDVRQLWNRSDDGVYYKALGVKVGR